MKKISRETKSEKKYMLVAFCLSVFFILSQSAGYCQGASQSLWHATLVVNSDKWEIKMGRKMFGDIKRLEFGPFAVSLIEKIDSPLIKRKIKGGPELQLLLGYDAEQRNNKGAFLDVTKKVTIEKTKYYRVLLANGADTTETLCSHFSSSTEERRTVAGSILNGSKDNGPSVIGTVADINGFIITSPDSLPWNFSYHFSSDNGNRSVIHSPGFLKNQTDSFYIKPIIDTSTYEFKLFKKTTTDTIYHTAGMALLNQKGEQIAAYQYPKKMATSAKDTKSFIWMRKDLNDSYRQAISSFWAILVVF